MFTQDIEDQVLKIYDSGGILKDMAAITKTTQTKVKDFLSSKGLNPTNNWKGAVINNLVNHSPGKEFKIVQIKGLNNLFEIYPCRRFWERLNFGKKFESINYLKYPPYDNILKTKYGYFMYNPPEEKYIHEKGDYEAPKWGGKKRIKSTKDLMNLDKVKL